MTDQVSSCWASSSPSSVYLIWLMSQTQRPNSSPLNSGVMYICWSQSSTALPFPATTSSEAIIQLAESAMALAVSIPAIMQASNITASR